MSDQSAFADGASSSPQTATSVAVEVLFVDLDGTLIATDMLWESFLELTWSSPRRALDAVFTLPRGRSSFKRAVAERSLPAMESLPFRQDVLDFIRRQRAEGRKVVLATASDRLHALQVSEHLGCFDDVLSTDATVNLKGANKLAAIERYCQEKGYSSFGYVGDTHADLPIWRSAKEIYAVEPSRGLHRAIGQLPGSSEVVVPRRSRARAAFKALRPHQWVKNALIAVPLVLAHKVLDPERLVSVLVAIVAFSACASSVYLLNDLADLKSDRRHPTKRRRPFASGALPLAYGPPLIAGLISFAFGASALLLPAQFVALLGLYFVLNLLYSGWLKRKPIVDIMLLAGMYALRVLAGGLAVDVPVSEWLLAFSLFFFLSLAFVKRYAELQRLSNQQEEAAVGRGYRASDINLLGSMGVSSGYLAVLVLALYVNSEHVRSLYVDATPLWLVCGLLLFWISRIWFWASRGDLLEDPVVFALTDRMSLIVGALSCGLLALAAWGGLHGP